jgi:hypothetical protein
VLANVEAQVQAVRRIRSRAGRASIGGKSQRSQKSKG